MEFDYKILAKYIIGEITFEEQTSLVEWSQLSEENNLLLKKIVEARILKKFVLNNSKEKTEQALLTLHNKIERKSIWSILRPYLGYVALFFLLIFSSVLGSIYYSASHEYISIVVKPGEKIKKIVLEDSSVVWLNSESVLRIPTSFSPKKRVVKLEGEAFFDITKQKGIPFRVETEHVDVKVLGTSFNLNTEAADNAFEAVLVSGKIVLQDKHEKDILRMSPSEKVIYSPSRNEYSIETVDTNVSTAWHLNQMTFENSTLREIVNKLSMLYDVNINIESKELADRRYRCVINRDETLIEVLDILKYLAPITYRIEGNEVFISK